MSESRARLLALKEALIFIFPAELLPIINDYVKAPAHEWLLDSLSSIHLDAEESLVCSATELKVRCEEWMFATGKFNTDDGPLRCAIDIDVTNRKLVPLNASAIFGISYPSMPKHEVAEINLERKSLLQIDFFGDDCITITPRQLGMFEGSYDLLGWPPKYIPRVVIEIYPNRSSLKISYISFEGDLKESFVDFPSWATWVRPHVWLRGHLSARLISC